MFICVYFQKALTTLNVMVAQDTADTANSNLLACAARSRAQTWTFQSLKKHVCGTINTIA